MVASGHFIRKNRNRGIQRWEPVPIKYIWHILWICGCHIHRRWEYYFRLESHLHFFIYGHWTEMLRFFYSRKPAAFLQVCILFFSGMCIFLLSFSGVFSFVYMICKVKKCHKKTQHRFCCHFLSTIEKRLQKKYHTNSMLHLKH